MPDVTDEDMHFSDRYPWRLDVRIGATDFETLHCAVESTLGRILRVQLKSHSEINNIYSLGGIGPGSGCISARVRCDTLGKIAELRAEADKLEAALYKSNGN